MLETNVNNFSEENKAHAVLKTGTKESDIREEIEDNAIRKTSVQSKSLKGHAEKLNEEFNHAMKQANYLKLALDEEKYQVLDCQENTDETIIKY